MGKTKVFGVAAMLMAGFVTLSSPTDVFGFFVNGVNGALLAHFVTPVSINNHGGAI